MSKNNQRQCNFFPHIFQVFWCFPLNRSIYITRGARFRNSLININVLCFWSGFMQSAESPAFLRKPDWKTQMKTEADGDGGDVIPTGFLQALKLLFSPLYLSSSSSNLNGIMLAVQLWMKSNNTNSSTMRRKWNFPLESIWKNDNRRCILLVFFQNNRVLFQWWLLQRSWLGNRLFLICPAFPLNQRAMLFLN